MLLRDPRFQWLLVAMALAVFAIPWPLWGVELIVAGLPIWIWYHIGWLGLTAIVFWVFTRRGWGVGMPTGGDSA